jgi:hypothetical protein
MTRTTYLGRLAQSLGPHTFAQVLRAALFFPKTNSFLSENPASGVTIRQESLDFASAIANVRTLADLVASGNIEDVTFVLQGLQDLMCKHTIHLEVFDMMVVERGGVPVVRIVQTSKPQTGRCVVVDMHDLSKKLMDIKVALDKLSWWNNPYIVAASTVALSALLVAALGVATRS